jgi:hypothetical protein
MCRIPCRPSPIPGTHARPTSSSPVSATAPGTGAWERRTTNPARSGWGEDPATSVTNAFGWFHHVTNAYAWDQSLFPTVGSSNPVLTALTLAKQMAEPLPV